MGSKHSKSSPSDIHKPVKTCSALGCNNRVTAYWMEDEVYCEHHQCKVKECKMRRIIISSTMLGYCTYHTCSNKDCYRPQIKFPKVYNNHDEYTGFCKKHTGCLFLSPKDNRFCEKETSTTYCTKHTCANDNCSEQISFNEKIYKFRDKCFRHM